MDDVTWGALTFTLTAIGGFYTWWAYRNRGATPAMRGLALTLLPAAAWLTGTLQMFTRIADAVSDWAIHLAFSPKVWLGVILAGLSVALFFVSGFLRNRGLGGGRPRGTDDAPAPKAVARPQAQPGPLSDDGLDDEIAAILKRRGIS
ncbi:cellulose synthase [Nocardioides agariphilus]|uniref:Cellulose synthase n=1 Tax=Nocardioides agariphilus TaxID=433664 RepID=A0A930VS50_9ACTN|nr:cellulose synthase [Nocardioides agariphilus]MBF4769850.1 cellulose synthase [Nocardioides agariphilus]